MATYFSREQLKKKGLSSGRTRRKQRENVFIETLRTGNSVMLLLFFFFAVLSAVIVFGLGHETAIFTGEPFKVFVVSLVISGTMMVHFHSNLPATLKKNSRVLLMLLATLVQLLAFRFSVFLADSFTSSEMSRAFAFLVAPYAFSPMLMTVLLGRNHGTFVAIYAALLSGLMVPAEAALPFMIFALISGFVAVYLTHQLRRRSRLISAGAYVGFACIVLGFALGYILFPVDGTPEAWEIMGRKCLAAILVSVLTAMIVGGVLPLLEGLFGITTNSSWLELADLNHPLLKRLTLEAPGTYHHSLVVATLAEAAAESVGANPVMCRVCAYFHDIGKLNKPQYYIENVSDGVSNPHDDLTPTMSAIIVIAHVKDGIDLALKYKLKSEIIDIIREHHGTSLVQFFYYRALKQREEVENDVAEGNAREEDVPRVDEESFRYPGPRPQTKESAIISLADSVESASRSLQKPTVQKIEQLIEDIFQSRLSDGQLDRASLTLRDLATIKESFATSLRSMMHARISYPKLPEEGAKKEKKGSKTQKLKKVPEAKTKSGEPVKPVSAKTQTAKAEATRKEPVSTAGDDKPSA